MSEPSYFDDPAAARALYLEAMSWVGTPFAQYYQMDPPEGVEMPKPDLKGMGGGIDCIGLVQEIMHRIGASEEFVFKREPADYQAANATGEKILDWLRGKIDNPQSRRLKEILVELEIPEVAKDPYAETPRDFFKPGDILVLRHFSLFHMPVIIDADLHFVNAIPRVGVIEGTIQDSTFSRHLVAAFRLKPNSKHDGGTGATKAAATGGSGTPSTPAEQIL